VTTLEALRWSETLDLAGFRARLGAPVLLLPRLVVDDGVNTDREVMSTAQQQLVDAQTAVAIDMGGEVLPLVRSAENPYTNKLAIGRTRNCDLRIDHASISRLHALLLMDEGGSVHIVDVGSSNGTRVNGKPVGRQRTPLVFGDVVTFGSVATQFVSEDMLYQALHNLRPHAG